MVNETNLGEKKVEKKEDEHVERKKRRGRGNEERTACSPGTTKSKTRGTLVADKDRK